MLKSIALAAASTLVALTASPAQSSVLYSYLGQTYDQAPPPNSSQLGNHRAIALTLADVLPANATNLSLCLSGCTISPLDFLVTGDGPIVASLANNSLLLPASVSTDSAGNIIGWSMTFIRLSSALVTSSTANSYPDLSAAVFDAGEVQNTHWGATTKGAWSYSNPQPVDSPDTLCLLSLGLALVGTRSSRLRKTARKIARTSLR
jgi:hypothetical protein